MSDNEIHDLALTSAKYFIENNMNKYANSSNGQSMLVSDLLFQYIKAKKQIHTSLPNVN